MPLLIKNIKLVNFQVSRLHLLQLRMIPSFRLQSTPLLVVQDIFKTSVLEYCMIYMQTYFDHLLPFRVLLQHSLLVHIHLISVKERLPTFRALVHTHHHLACLGQLTVPASMSTTIATLFNIRKRCFQEEQHGPSLRFLESPSMTTSMLSVYCCHSCKNHCTVG